MLGCQGSLKAVTQKLTPIVEKRLMAHKNRSDVDQVCHHDNGLSQSDLYLQNFNDAIGWTIECIKDKRPLAVIQELLVFTFAGMHQPVMV